MWLAPASVLASNAPRWLAWAAVPVVFAAGFAQWRKYLRQRRIRLRVCVEGPLEVDGVLFEEWRLQWRGRLAFIQWRSGRWKRWQACSFWPDTLPAALQRELRLATPTAKTSAAPVPVAT